MNALRVIMLAAIVLMVGVIASASATLYPTILPDPSSGTVPLDVDFDFSVTSDVPGDYVTHVEWEFGDGSPHVTTYWPTHTYTAAGNYDVTLWVWNKTGYMFHTAYWTNDITVLPPPPPTPVPPTWLTVTADSTWLARYEQTQVNMTTDGTEPLFDVDSNCDGVYDWIDYTNQVPPIPREQHATFGWGSGAVGTWVLKMQAKNALGYKTATKSITVSDPYGTPADANSMGANVTEGTAPLTVAFTVNATGYYPMFGYDWTNDGSYDLGTRNPVRSTTYPAGTFTAKCRVQNTWGTDYAYKTVVSHMKGDYNGNLDIDFADVSGLQSHIDNGYAYQNWMDMNNNGLLDYADVSILFGMV